MNYFDFEYDGISLSNMGYILCSFDSGGGSGISTQALALQAIQNAYQSTSSAISQAIKKNRAKIKYNTVVYLINEQ